MGKRSPAVTDYIAGFPPATRKRLRVLRQTIIAAAPEAEETMSYGIPAFKLAGILVYFAGFKNHIGFYPRTTAIKKFNRELAGFEHAKGSVRFSHKKPLPLSLVTRIVRFREKENRKKVRPEARK